MSFDQDGCLWCSRKLDCECLDCTTDICGCIDDPCPHPGGLVHVESRALVEVDARGYTHLPDGAVVIDAEEGAKAAARLQRAIVAAEHANDPMWALCTMAVWNPCEEDGAA